MPRIASGQACENFRKSKEGTNRQPEKTISDLSEPAQEDREHGELAGRGGVRIFALGLDSGFGLCLNLGRGLRAGGHRVTFFDGLRAAFHGRPWGRSNDHDGFGHRSTTLSLALRARGLTASSWAVAVTGFLVRTVSLGSDLKDHLTRRSSSE